MNQDKVYIIGAGGHGEVVWDTLEELGYSPSGFWMMLTLRVPRYPVSLFWVK